MNPLQAFASHTATTPSDPFALRFGTPLPRALRTEAAGMNWRTFLATYSPPRGPIRFGRWSAHALGAGRSEFRATLALGDTIHQAKATAAGPIAALTSMLYDAGVQLEILSFHQQDAGGRTATFLLCEHDGRRHWSVGLADTATESSIEAMIAGANILHG
ncbi:alpha-isopropylmalate synthase regulatory domain-containing protein [Rhodococcus sp. NPDC058514]|uniref:alpha-isopropylmalate synthase regulatory domain-containing protein n=1 Tax=unclassified Rhodococcus (in: high G+C Gram-positive bacteria) TaxID=192944 RepID=UPI00365F5C2F